MNKLISINPSNYQEIGSVDISTESEIIQKVDMAHKAFLAWSQLDLEKRIELLRKVFDEFANRKEELAQLESREMGMPINDALMDVDGTLQYAHWYLDNAKQYLSSETTFESEAEIHEVFYEPIGVVACILPWNFPFANFVWSSVQALIAGNVVLFKHSEEVPLCGKFIEEVVTNHLPEGVFSEIYGDGEVGKMLLTQDIDMVTFTGSTRTGKSIYETAGKKFIKAVVELGGSAPGIIFEDADLDQAIGNVCFSRLLNQGQCCDGLKRLIVHESILEKVIEKLKLNFENKRIGNAINTDTDIGPLVSQKQLLLLESQVNDAISKGAKVIVGGKSLEENMVGAFFEPTILTNINAQMSVWSEEVFGPVLPIVTFKDEVEAIKIANDTVYGLGAYVYTSNNDVATRVSQSLQSGMVSINSTNYIMPFNPFGGYKNSGMGRQHGKFGFHEVVQAKVVARNK